MKIKIIGIGKCGIRIAYDLFAYNKGLPSAYEIRLDRAGSGLNSALDKIGISREKMRESITKIQSTFKKIVGELDALYRFAEDPIYVTIDSDSANNEIVNRVILFSDSSEGDDLTPGYQFPGQNYDLNNHVGGCNFHVVSEKLARDWKFVPNDIVDSSGISIFVTSFSIGGGTGGGSAPIICSRSKAAINDKNRCHYMGLGVLPKSDEPYVETDVALSMSDYEKFSTGRFLVSTYSNRIPESMNSLWLFSNDTLRFLVSSQAESNTLTSISGEMNLNLSLVNFFIAQSLTVLANSSSSLTNADSNLDPRELNDFLNRSPFISGMSQRLVEDVESTLDHQVLAVKKLLLGALTNVKVDSGQLEGLSVPIITSDLNQLESTLDDAASNYENFMRAIDSYDASKGPIEFQTTHRLIILYGQPQKRSTDVKKNMILRACEKIFPDAQKLEFTFRHHASTETLLLLLVDPFIQPIISSIYYYANNAWSKTGANLRDEFDNLISTDKFKTPTMFEQNEIFPESIYGGGTDDVKKLVEEEESKVEVNHDNIVNAFRHLHEIYHRKRPSTKTSSKLRRKKRSPETAKPKAKSRHR